MSLLSVPLNVEVLKALEERPLALTDLRRAVGSPPQTTLRGHLKKLTEMEIVKRTRRDDFPGTVDLELGPPGRTLMAVAEVLQTWLSQSPDGSLALGSSAARGSIKAMVDGWCSGIVRVLAARPLSLTELNRLIAELNYPSLERRLGAMRLAGQIEASPGRSRGTPYTVTTWLRHAIAPVTAAVRWERRHAAATSDPIGRRDIESIFLLALPLLRLPADTAGNCRLAVEVRGEGGQAKLIGALVGIKAGRVASYVARLQGEADAWASGPVAGWLDAIVDGELDWLEVGGDGTLAITVLEGLHDALFRIRQKT